MTRIGIIRHGTTAWNKEGRAQGSSDIPLDIEGLSQARALGVRLSKENWDVVYSSNLLRAKQTAEIVGEHFGIDNIIFDARLREIGGGQIEGTTEEERVLKWGKSWRELDLGIESQEVGTSRALSFIEDVANKHINKNILVVSHGSLIRHLLKGLLPHVNTAEHLKNTSLTRIIKTNNTWDCELYNCTIHINEDSI
jgi:probable phosphoglycerate mutase